MKVTVTTSSDMMFTLEVSEDMELENFKALCEFELGIPAQDVGIVWNGSPLTDDKKKLKDYGIQDGEVLLAQRIQGSSALGGSQQQPASQAAGSGGFLIDFSNIQVPGGSRSSQPPAFRPSQQQQRSIMEEDPAVIREMLLSSPHEIAILKQRNPRLADALLSESLEKFTEVLQAQQAERVAKERERIAMLSGNPFDPNVQQKIAEEIRQQNVDALMETAMEYHPESFAQVVMLYINCTVNGHHVKAFVDSGAQMTIMSQKCAERCNIMRLVDTRWAGVAMGVGRQKIIGRVHLGQVQIGNDFLQSSFSILEDQPMDMLLGLDMLKRHQCCIDLKKNVLTIDTTGTETPFLPESELPEYAKLNRQMSDPEREFSSDKELAEALSRSAQETAGSSEAGTSTSQEQSSRSRFPESDIIKIISSGFSREQAIQELEKSNGDVQKALLGLLAKSLKFPK